MQGRGFIFVSQFAKALPAESAGLYLDAAIQAIESTTASDPVKISAVRAVQKCVIFTYIPGFRTYFDHYSFTKDGAEDVIRPYAVRIIKDLCPFLAVISDDSLLLVLETVSLVIAIDEASWVTEELANDLTTVVLGVYSRTKKGDSLFLAVPTICLTCSYSGPDDDFCHGGVV